MSFKKMLLLSVCCVLLPFLGGAGELRLLTYNIHAGIGVDRKFDLERIAKVIRDVKPHVVALQEVDKETKRTKGVDLAKELGQLTQMKHVFGASIPFGGGEYGNALLTSLDIRSSRVIPIPEVVPVEKRSLLVTELLFKGEPIKVVATHLCHRQEENRLKASELIVEQFGKEPSLTFVMGDLNAVPDSKPLLALKNAGWRKPSLKEMKTIPVVNPKRQIDYVLYRPGQGQSVNVNEVRVLEEQVASDHRALLVVLEIGE